jgi:ribosomal protein L12E/L44/L45/RPP1/RPP2
MIMHIPNRNFSYFSFLPLEKVARQVRRSLRYIDKDEDPHLEGEIVGIIWQDDVKEGRSTIAGGWRAKVVELDPASLSSGFPKALEDGNEILYCLNETLIAMVLDSKWNSKFIAIVGRQIEEVESDDDDDGAVAIAGGQEESKKGEEEEAKKEWSITFDEEEEELQRPPSRKGTRRGGHGS